MLEVYFNVAPIVLALNTHGFVCEDIRDLYVKNIEQVE